MLCYLFFKTFHFFLFLYFRAPFHDGILRSQHARFDMGRERDAQCVLVRIVFALQNFTFQFGVKHAKSVCLE